MSRILYFLRSPYRHAAVIAVLITTSCSNGYKDQDGNQFKSVKIGKQEWTAENLSVTHFRNGDEIPEVTNEALWQQMGKEGKPARCTGLNNTENGKKYGMLYNWYAVNDMRGLAPDGWHIPSDAEWTRLTDFLGGETAAAFRMRTTAYSDNNKESGSNSFQGLPGGSRNDNGAFIGIGSHSYWWSDTEINTASSWSRLLNYLNCNIFSIAASKSSGYSVRCLKN
jgi:uncharacterized protein (TIGR02145 family)